MRKSSKSTQIEKARAIFQKHGGTLRTAQALRGGVHRRTLYLMREKGLLERLGRGLYRLADSPPLDKPDLVTVALKVPHGVVCLISALAYYDLTTQIPHELYIALKKGAEPPRLDYPPIRLFWCSPKSFEAGMEVKKIDGVSVRIYSIEKTLADCFKFRNQVGVDTALEALKSYLKQKTPKIEELLQYAKICRVEKIMRPYLEALL